MFTKGDRIVPSEEGIRQNMFRKPFRIGTVIRTFVNLNLETIVVVRWDGTKTPSNYHPTFIKKEE
jgi:hypothetical protein